MAAAEGEVEMDAVIAEWQDDVYEKRVPDIVSEVNARHCGLTEWVEQPMPTWEKGIRGTIVDAAPFIPEDIAKVAAEGMDSIKDAGKLDILLLGDVSGFGAAVCARLKARKQLGSLKTIKVWEAAQKEAAPSEETVKAWFGDGDRAWDIVLFTAAIDPPASNDPDDIIWWSDALVKTYLMVCQTILKNPKLVNRGIVAVSADAFAYDAPSHAKAGLGIVCGGFLFGMTNTVRMEMPCAMHYVDVEYEVDDETLESCAAEIARKTGFGENSVRLTSKARYVARQVLAEPKYATNWVFKTPAAGVVAIGGGNGALGLVMGKYLLEHLEDPSTATLKILFLSRSAKISGDSNLKAWAEIEAFCENTSIRVQQTICDVSKRDAIVDLIEENVGPSNLVGFIHSAGVLRDGMLVNQTADKYDDVYKPKAWAALYLHAALADCHNLEFCWMFSSVAVMGNVGQSNYSGANSFLDVLCRHRKSHGLPATAMQWAGWGEVGMAASMEEKARKRMEDSHIPLFTNKQGLHGMDVGLSTGIPVFCVMRYNTDAFFKLVNAPAKAAWEKYTKRFWQGQVPPKKMHVLDVYDTVLANYVKPKQLLYDHFVAHLSDDGDALEADCEPDSIQYIEEPC